MWLDTPLWDLRSAHGSNGVYRVTVDEEQRVYLRLEAEGYETLETEVLFTNETNVTCDLKLESVRHRPMIRGVVRLPDGNPAAGVEVALCTAEIGVKVRGTTFEPGIFGNAGPAPREYRRVTDAQGSFLFDLKPDAHTVVAPSSAGIGQARCLDASQPLEIRLQRWGRIEGTRPHARRQLGRIAPLERGRKTYALDDNLLRTGWLFHAFRRNGRVHAGARPAGILPRGR